MESSTFGKIGYESMPSKIDSGCGLNTVDIMSTAISVPKKLDDPARSTTTSEDMASTTSLPSAGQERLSLASADLDNRASDKITKKFDAADRLSTHEKLIQDVVRTYKNWDGKDNPQKRDIVYDLFMNDFSSTYQKNGGDAALKELKQSVHEVNLELERHGSKIRLEFSQDRGFRQMVAEQGKKHGLKLDVYSEVKIKHPSGKVDILGFPVFVKEE